MGFQKCWQITRLLIVFLFLLSLVEGSETNDLKSLHALVLDKANKEIANPRTGTFYNVSLSANFSGIEVSAVRIRTASFWSRGVNYSFLNLPLRIIPEPNVKRMAIVYENIGNWSSHYFNVPEYTMVAPVLGFMVYVSSETTLIGSEKMNLSILENPITIMFPQGGVRGKNETPICAKFGDGGLVELSKMTRPYVCETQSQGYYGLVVPSSPRAGSHRQGKWGMVGLGLGFVGLVFLVLVFVGVVKVVKMRRIRKMEKKSERGVPFDTFFVGESKMPSASMIRTQAVLENDDTPHHI